MKKPTLKEFQEYTNQRLCDIGDNPLHYSEWVMAKYMAWEANGWKKTIKGNDIPIKNWKSTIIQCLPYRMPNKVKKIEVSQPMTITERLLSGN